MSLPSFPLCGTSILTCHIKCSLGGNWDRKLVSATLHIGSGTVHPNRTNYTCIPWLLSCFEHAMHLAAVLCWCMKMVSERISEGQYTSVASMTGAYVWQCKENNRSHAVKSPQVSLAASSHPWQQQHLANPVQRSALPSLQNPSCPGT
jgi:hypothetical protein